MRVTCNSCGAKYTIADDKVRGRRVKVRCKGCGTPIVVDGNTPDADADAGAARDTAPAQSISIPPPDRLPFEVDEGSGADSWSVNLSETEQRDMTVEEIVSGWAAGTVTTDAFVWKDGMDDWKPILEVPELASRLPKQPAATAQKPAPAKAAAARVGPRSTADLFGGVEQAGSEDEPTSMAAAAAATPYADHKATGARNENSVLFSLDSLKSAATAAPAAAKPGPKPKPPAKRQGLTSSPDDPFGMNLGVGGISAGPSALFGADTNALLTAPAPPEPPPPKPIPIAITDTGAGVGVGVPVTQPPKSKKLIIAGVAIAALVGIGVVVSMSGSKKENESAAAESASAALAAKTEPKKPEDKPLEAKPEDKPAESAPAPAASSAAPSETAAKVAQGPSTTKGPSTTTSTKEPDKPAVKDTPSSGVESFNKGAAIAALSASAAQATSCKRPGGPTGTGHAIVTFATSGRVTSANVAGPPFGGTAVGGCIASVFRRAHVPAFSGSPVTVSKSFTLSP